ncbi:MAG: DUF4124 domain-containing protein [Halioglobus sp.]
MGEMAVYRILAFILLLGGTPGITATVYKTVAENGVVSFSDTPIEGTTPIEVLQVTPAPAQAPAEYLQQLEAMRKTTDRMASDRREREKHRAQLKESSARAASYREPEPAQYTQYADYFPRYTRRHHRRKGNAPWWSGYRPKPVHPIAVPLRHDARVIGSSNSQLMRPLVSTRR